MKFTDINGLVDAGMLLHNRYLVVQKGKKNYFVVDVK
jgi:hypothetical protein